MPMVRKRLFRSPGCLFQAVWNRRSARPVDAGIKGYDVFYFDDGDLGSEAEDRVIRRFGAGYPPLVSTEDGIGRYLVACTCVGIRVADLFQAKAESYRARWPWSRIAPPGP
ncbi:MAG TPA: nucleotidyltransferase family protein [Aliidongia sp.]|uniref:nucleotidyltransferase family protein n=1 Tax=Aliidongia sp. TaxID=1914230 RepID=UPI002DDCFCDE|nr:nucleotidyltransferase family protein [Aliidongia sp.]HEV2678243.1 nucleotidyltransferase family protein [Aliidongia sp.]